MTDLRKAAEQALETLEQLQGGCTDSSDGTIEAVTVWCPEVIDSLRAALAEFDGRHQTAGTAQTFSKQAPVAWRFRPGPARPWAITDDGYYASCMRDKGYPIEPLYAAAQPAEVGVNLPPPSNLRAAAEQALECLDGVARGDYDGNAQGVCEALLAALAEPQDEPVAKVELMTRGGNAGLATRIVEIYDHLRERLRPGQMLYTHPAPQRKPLSDAEIESIAVETEDAGHGWAGDMNRISNHGFFTADSLRAFVRAVEKLHGIT